MGATPLQARKLANEVGVEKSKSQRTPSLGKYVTGEPVAQSSYPMNQYNRPPQYPVVQPTQQPQIITQPGNNINYQGQNLPAGSYHVNSLNSNQSTVLSHMGAPTAYYPGPLTWIICLLFCFPCIFLCPVDQRTTSGVTMVHQNNTTVTTPPQAPYITRG